MPFLANTVPTALFKRILLARARHTLVFDVVDVNHSTMAMSFASAANKAGILFDPNLCIRFADRARMGRETHERAAFTAHYFSIH